MARLSSNPSLVGVPVVAVFFLLLFFLPKLFVQKKFNFPVPEQAAQADSLSQTIDRPLKIIHGSQWVKSLGITKSKTSLRELQKASNRNVLLNFWATWCPPCIEEFPSLEYLNRRVSSSDEKLPLLVTVSVDESERDVAKLFKTLGYEPSLIVLHDVDGDISRAFGTVKFPETYLLNAEGQVVHKWIGPQNWLSRAVIEEFSAP